jgi:hypothetical protein
MCHLNSYFQFKEEKEISKYNLRGWIAHDWMADPWRVSRRPRMHEHDGLPKIRKMKRSFEFQEIWPDIQTALQAVCAYQAYVIVVENAHGQQLTIQLDQQFSCWCSKSLPNGHQPAVEKSRTN